MRLPIRSERQQRRALSILLEVVEVEELHIAQCESIETCKMLSEVHEAIAWVRSQATSRHICRDYLPEGRRAS